MSQIRLEILKTGDSVLNVWPNTVAIKRKNGDVEVLTFRKDDDNLLRQDKDATILITKGKGVVRYVSDDSKCEVGTF